MTFQEELLSKFKLKFRCSLVMLVSNRFTLWKIYFKKKNMSAFSNFWSGGGENLFYKYVQTKIVLAQILSFKVLVCSSTSV